MSGYANIPHYKKRERGGEDSWIVADKLIAVADGVGGWNNKGVDPGIFTKELCNRVNNRYAEMMAAGQLRRFSVDLWELLVS